MDMSISGNYHCPNWVDYPLDTIGATGGLLGENPVICGGGTKNLFTGFVDPSAGGSNECYLIKAKENVLIAKMTEGRGDAASVVIDDTHLWVTGGRCCFGYIMSSSDYVHINGSFLGIYVPYV